MTVVVAVVAIDRHEIVVVEQMVRSYKRWPFADVCCLKPTALYRHSMKGAL